MDYLVECFYQTATHQLLVLSGDHRCVCVGYGCHNLSSASLSNEVRWVFHYPLTEEECGSSMLLEENNWYLLAHWEKDTLPL